MTKQEYNAAYSAARRKAGRLTAAGMRELKTTYEKAGEDVARVVRDAKARSLSDLTIQSREGIRKQLEDGANNIRNDLDNMLNKQMRRASKTITDIDAKYLKEALPTGINITAAGIESVSAIVNERVVRSVINRIFSDGYTLSERIWRAGSDYPVQMNRVLAAGFAQGRDPVKIAKDMEVYIADGKRKLAERYGPNLRSGTKQWVKRIRGKVDYRALRLVRSELYMSLQEAGRESGRANPGAMDQYDWILNPGRQQWGCVCPDNAAGSPYTYQNVPSYPHPHCACRTQARLRKRKTFVNDLKKWSRGQDVEYLDQWNREFYVPATQ